MKVGRPKKPDNVSGLQWFLYGCVFALSVTAMLNNTPSEMVDNFWSWFK